MSTLLFRYVPGNSFLHMLDPRVKITAMLVASISIFMSSTFREMAAILLVFYLLLLISSVSPRVVFGSLRPMLIFLALIFTLQLFLTGGDPLFSLMGLDATYQGLVKGSLLILRFILLLMFASLLTATTSPSMMTAGIERMLRPLPSRKFGISSFDLATMMFLSLHFVPLLYESFNHLRDSQISRGLDAKKNPARALYSLSVPMIRTAFSSAEDVAVAMESRCYQGHHRSSLHEPQLRKKDLLSLLFFAIVMLLVI
ncbi:MAG: energy-coupling factor transport system permease protein [Methanolobus sp.]|nr:energy-coupling factor transport system permease protein [Methanolobus sp.]MDK2911065.1 energy-coupling factor transport system permease protein [Methanolobus sp.]MDN5309012.1 energy-coupling factor transport system permease protein [Methanolobus sp.]